MVDERQIRLFWERVDKEGSDDCWEWKGDKSSEGYGRLGRDPYLAAHRISFYLHYGHMDLEKVVHHKCNNKSCVNPNHLMLISQVENMRQATIDGKMNNGKNFKNKKLNEQAIKVIRYYVNKGVKKAKLAKLHKVHVGTIYNVINQSREYYVAIVKI